MAKIKRGSIAFILSIVVPGLGHAYDSRLLAGVLIAVIFPSLVYLAGLLGLLHRFPDCDLVRGLYLDV